MKYWDVRSFMKNWARSRGRCCPFSYNGIPIFIVVICVCLISWRPDHWSYAWRGQCPNGQWILNNYPDQIKNVHILFSNSESPLLLRSAKGLPPGWQLYDEGKWILQCLDDVRHSSWFENTRVCVWKNMSSIRCINRMGCCSTKERTCVSVCVP